MLALVRLPDGLSLTCTAKATCRSRRGTAVAAEHAQRRKTAIWSGRPRRLLAPAPPADPDVRDYRIRLLESRVCCITSPAPLFVVVAFTQNDSSTMSRCVSFRRFRD